MADSGPHGFAAAPRLLAVWDPQGRTGALDRAFAAFRATPGFATGLPLQEPVPEAPALRRTLRLAVEGPVPVDARPCGGLAAGPARLVDGPHAGETRRAGLARLAAALEAGRFDAPGPVAPVEGDFAVLHVAETAGAPRLALLRDAFGGVPIWHSRSPDGLVAVSTDPLALLALPWAPAEPDADRLAGFADTLRLPHAGSLWPGIEAARPGALTVFRPDGRADTRVWWRPGPDPALAGLTDAAILDAAEARARAAVSGAARALGPDPAVMISGGLDSTLLAALLVADAPERPRAGYVSVSPSGPSEEERGPQAAVFAAFPQIARHDVTSKGIDPLAGGEAFWRGQALPCFDLVEFKTLALLARMGTDGRTGVLSGVGGDLVVSLPSRTLMAEAVRTADPNLLAEVWRVRRAAGGGRKGLILREILRRMPGFGWLGRLDPAERPLDSPLNPARSRRRAARFLAAGQGPWPAAPGRLLEEERALLDPSLAWVAADRLLPGPEGFVAAPAARPLLDTRLLAAVMAAPPRLKLHQGRDRGLMRRLLACVGAPEAVRARPGKSLFEPDLPRLHHAAALAQRPRLRAAHADHALFRELVDLPLAERRLEALARTPPGPASAPEAFGVLLAAQLALFLDRVAARRP